MTSQEQNIEILKSALEERYRAQHTIRERVQNINIWSLGLMIGASGWLFQNDKHLSSLERIALFTIVVLAFYVLRFHYLTDLERGFRDQQQVGAKIETVLGLHEAGYFDATTDPMFPKKWKMAGTSSGGGRFFNSSIKLLYTGVCILLLAIIFSGHGDSGPQGLKIKHHRPLHCYIRQCR